MSSTDDTTARVAPVRLFNSSEAMHSSGSMTMGVPDENTPLAPAPDARVPVHPRDLVPKPMPREQSEQVPDESGQSEQSEQVKSTKSAKAAEAAKDPVKTGDDLPF